MTISVPKTMKKFEIESTKSFVPNLEKAERVGEVLSTQSYNPIYNIFFQNLDDTNYNDYSFKQNEYIVDNNHVSKILCKKIPNIHLVLCLLNRLL